jgi:hypothetical protein
MAAKTLGRVSVLLAFAALTVPPAEAAAPAPTWTKTYAEAVLLLKLRLPCKNVRSPAACSLAAAVRRLAQSERRLAACKLRTTESTSARACTEHADSDAARTNVADLRRGFPLHTAHCTGGGDPSSGRRYSVFRCAVTVRDDASAGGPVDVSGRLLVTVTGRATFVWQAIR